MVELLDAVTLSFVDYAEIPFIVERIAAAVVLLAAVAFCAIMVRRVFAERSTFVESAWRPLLVGIIIWSSGQVVGDSKLWTP